MPAVTEGPRTAAYILSEARGNRSRANIIIATPSNIEPGEVLGKVTASGKFVPLDPAASDGSEVAAAISYDAYDATAADVDGVGSVRDMEAIADNVIWPDGITGPEKTAALSQLEAIGIIVR